MFERERFVAYLTEVYKGAFPTWLAPIQATIIPVSVDAHGDYAYEIKERLQMKGLRVEVDDRNDYAHKFLHPFNDSLCKYTISDPYSRSYTG